MTQRDSESEVTIDTCSDTESCVFFLDADDERSSHTQNQLPQIMGKQIGQLWCYTVGPAPLIAGRKFLKLLMKPLVDKMKGEMPFKIGLSRDKKRAKDREQLAPEDVFSPMLPSKGLKMLVSTK